MKWFHVMFFVCTGLFALVAILGMARLAVPSHTAAESTLVGWGLAVPGLCMFAMAVAEAARRFFS